MKEQKIIGAGIAVLVLAFLAGGLWWFTQSGPSTPNSSAVELAPLAPAPAPSTAQASQPADSPPAVAAAAASSAPTAAPPAELKTTIQEMARLIKAGDIATIQKSYRPPDKVAQLSEQDQAALGQLAQGAGMPEMFAMLAQELDSIQDQIPTYNAAGDTATYLAPKPDGLQGNLDKRPVTLVKVNGKWYLDSSASPDFWILF